MSITDWLVENMIRLRKADVDSPRRDCLVLLEDVLGKDRSWVVTNPEYRLSTGDLKKLERLLERRVSREPLAYIRGKAWFYGRFFSVSPSVLIPRPESESFVDMLKELGPEGILDIGTGSGCLAVTAKLELPEAKVIATDTSASALDIAGKNADAHGAEVEFRKGSLFQPLANTDLRSFTVVANLPYVPDGLVTSPEILAEPKEALFSGNEGLDHYEKFWEEVSRLSSKPQHILTESLEKQHADMKKLALEAKYKLERNEVLVQHFKLAA